MSMRFNSECVCTIKGAWAGGGKRSLDLNSEKNANSLAKNKYIIHQGLI